MVVVLQPVAHLLIKLFLILNLAPIAGCEVMFITVIDSDEVVITASEKLKAKTNAAIIPAGGLLTP